MKANQIVSENIKSNIKDATIWYNKRVKGLGNKFTSEVRDKVKFITENPLSFQIRYDKIRVAIIDSFPYTIHYYYDESKNNVVFLAVFHTSRNPEIWLK